MSSKICTKCNILEPIEEFGLQKHAGLQNPIWTNGPASCFIYAETLSPYFWHEGFAPWGAVCILLKCRILLGGSRKSLWWFKSCKREGSCGFSGRFYEPRDIKNVGNKAGVASMAWLNKVLSKSSGMQRVIFGCTNSNWPGWKYRRAHGMHAIIKQKAYCFFLLCPLKKLLFLFLFCFCKNSTTRSTHASSTNAEWASAFYHHSHWKKLKKKPVKIYRQGWKERRADVSKQRLSNKPECGKKKHSSFFPQKKQSFFKQSRR